MPEKTRVLVVDDDPRIVDILQVMLTISDQLHQETSLQELYYRPLLPLASFGETYIHSTGSVARTEINPQL